KRSRQSASDCAAELRGARHAHDILRAGGTYVMVLGADAVPDQNLDDRHVALLSIAVDLGLLDAAEGHRIRVYGADHVARWASEFPSLAMDPVVQGLNPGATDFDSWRDSR